MIWLLLIHLAATWTMVGLIWFVQVVHYPLLGFVPEREFVAYEQSHVRLTGWVVAGPMLLEATTALALVVWLPASAAWLGWTGLFLLALIWVSTAWLQVPQHDRLLQGFDAEAHRRLVFGNWLRTFAWTLRGIATLALVVQSLNY